MVNISCQCIECGETFSYEKNGPGQIRTLCSDECKQIRSKRHSKPYEKQGKRRVRVVCVTCGKKFSYEKEGPGANRKTCSKECTMIRYREHGRRNYERNGHKYKYSGKCVVCGKQFSAFVKATITCGRSCGKRLSDKTRSINADNKRFERTGRRDNSDLVHRREKAEWKRRGDNIDRTKLFERDGWRCYICGDETPREMMGSHHPRAPEVDHIIPFAAGGQHTWVNTACACRSCNSAKKDSLTETAMTFMELGLF